MLPTALSQSWPTIEKNQLDYCSKRKKWRFSFCFIFSDFSWPHTIQENFCKIGFSRASERCNSCVNLIFDPENHPLLAQGREKWWYDTGRGLLQILQNQRRTRQQIPRNFLNNRSPLEMHVQNQQLILQVPSTFQRAIAHLKARKKRNFIVIVADFQIADQKQKTFLKEITKEIPLRISTRLRILDPNIQTGDIAFENPWKTESSNNTGWILSLANQNETNFSVAVSYTHLTLPTSDLV